MIATSTMIYKNIYLFINVCIAVIWLINGLVCKILNVVPRHRQIVGRILGSGQEEVLTTFIGCSEILMAIWIISGIKSRINAIVQTLVIGTMNVIEFIYAPDLLLWGKSNILFAAMLMLIIVTNEFYIKPKGSVK